MTPQRVRAIRHGLLLAGIAMLAFVGYTALVPNWLHAAAAPPGEAYDAGAYWAAAHEADPYARPVLGAPVAYYYSPAFLQVFSPLLALPFGAFLGAWYLLNAGALIAVARHWLPLAMLTGFVGLEVMRGNIETLMALAIVAGFRWPAAWAFILLTKVTPGVGLLWFVGRREWRNLAIAVGATLAVSAVSFVIAPGLWLSWIGSLVANTGVNIDWPFFPVPLLVRLPIAAALALIAGIRGWRWLVPVASTLAMPALWPVNLTLLVAVIPLLGGRDRVAVEDGAGAAGPAADAPDTPATPDAPDTAGDARDGARSKPTLETA